MKEKLLKNNQLIFFIVAIIIILILGGFLKLVFFGRLKQTAQLVDHQQVFAQLGSKRLNLEVVNTPESTARGLSGRDSLGADGMLFIFPKARILTFWMKQMKFNLDMIWLENNKVIDISYDVPVEPEGIKDNMLPIYSPRQAADMVIEVVAGKTKEWNIQIGDDLYLIK